MCQIALSLYCITDVRISQKEKGERKLELTLAVTLPKTKENLNLGIA